MNVPNLKDRPCMGEQDPPDQLITICSSDLTHVQTEKRNKVFARTAKRKGKGRQRERERGSPPVFRSFLLLPYLTVLLREKEREKMLDVLSSSLSLFAPSKRERGEELVCRRRYHHCFSLREREREREERRAKSLCFPAGLCVKQQGRSAADEQGKRLSERKKKSGCFNWKHLLVSRTRKLFKFYTSSEP